MLQVYFRRNKLQSKNVQTVPKYQFKYQSFKHERGKPEIQNYVSNSNNGNII